MAKTFTAETAAKLTADDIEDLTGPELVAAYNALANKARQALVVKFQDRKTGIKRLAVLVQQVGFQILEEEMEKAALPPVKGAPKTAKPAKTPSAKKPSVSGRCRELILAGKTNEEIWAVIKTQFKLDDSKRSYPAWNRSSMARKGLV